MPADEPPFITSSILFTEDELETLRDVVAWGLAGRLMRDSGGEEFARLVAIGNKLGMNL